ncbi:MAG: hypothetical protein IT204_24670 [Fimbriimonadaceae bacterium]|nr:hypothetical protein [Fimbriimonadaceae bacterium]
MAEPAPPWPRLVTWAVGLTALLVLLTSTVVPLRVGDVYIYLRVAVPLLPRLLLPAAGCLGLLAWVRWAAHGTRRRVTVVVVMLGWWLLVGVMVAPPAGPAAPVTVMYADGSNSYLATAHEVGNVFSFVRDYQRSMPSLRLHAQTQAPGATLVHWLPLQALRQSALFQGLLELLAARFGRGYTVPDYAVAQLWLNQVRLTPPEAAAGFWIAVLWAGAIALTAGVLHRWALHLSTPRAAALATALWLTAPAVWCYTPTVDGLWALGYVVFTALCWRASSVDCRPQPLAWLGLGVLAGFGLFFNLGYVLLPVWAAGLLLSLGAPGSRRWRCLVALVAGWLLALLLLHLLLGYQALAVGLEAGRLRAHWWGRGHLLFACLNLPEFWLGLGVPTAVVALVAAVRGGDAATRTMLLLLLALQAILSIAGLVRGETARMWLFAMPVNCLAATDYLDRRWPDRTLAADVLLLAAQLTAAWAMLLNWCPWGTFAQPLYEARFWF